MDNTDPTADDPSNAEVIVAEDPNGALVIGGDSAVAEFVAQWEGREPQSRSGRRSPGRNGRGSPAR